MNYPTKLIYSISSDAIYIRDLDSLSHEFLIDLGAKKLFLSKKKWYLNYYDEASLALYLSQLRDNDFVLSGAAHGWPPSAIFSSLRDKGLITGEGSELVYKGPNQPTIRII